MLTPGTTYLINMAPGWIMAGTVVDVKDGFVTFQDGVYVERIADGHSAVGSLPMATTATEFQRIATRLYKVSQPLSVKVDNITFFIPCKTSLAEVA